MPGTSSASFIITWRARPGALGPAPHPHPTPPACPPGTLAHARPGKQQGRRGRAPARGTSKLARRLAAQGGPLSCGDGLKCGRLPTPLSGGNMHCPMPRRWGACAPQGGRRRRAGPHLAQQHVLQRQHRARVVQRRQRLERLQEVRERGLVVALLRVQRARLRVNVRLRVRRAAPVALSSMCTSDQKPLEACQAPGTCVA
jgi:hypothetical protein